MTSDTLNDLIRKDYPLIGVLKLDDNSALFDANWDSHQEGLPAYWGIETPFKGAKTEPNDLEIRKDYPLIGVLKPVEI